MTKKIAMFSGSFDPVTLGHLDIIQRAASLFDELYVVVGNNINKRTLFDTNVRKMFIETEVQRLNLSNVHVVVWSGLTVDFAQQKNVNVLVRGVRTMMDFNYEYEMAQMNRVLCKGLETVLIPSKPEFAAIRSTSVRELISFGSDISAFVPASVVDFNH